MTANLGQRRAHARAGAADIEKAVAEATMQLADETKARYEAAKARAAEEETSRHRFTRDEVEGARAVKDRYGQWRRVIRVNATTVTVPDTWGIDTARIPFGQIRGVR